MEVSGYFVREEAMKNLSDIAEKLYWTYGIYNMSSEIRDIIKASERVAGNADTEAELAGRELHGVGIGLWDEDNTPKIDVAAKLKARLLAKKV